MRKTKQGEYLTGTGITDEILDVYDPEAVRKELVPILSGIRSGRKPRPFGAVRHRIYCTDDEYVVIQCMLSAMRKKEVFKQLVDS
jgi:hypothetical protein